MALRMCMDGMDVSSFVHGWGGWIVGKEFALEFGSSRWEGETGIGPGGGFVAVVDEEDLARAGDPLLPEGRERGGGRRPVLGREAPVLFGRSVVDIAHAPVLCFLLFPERRKTARNCRGRGRCRVGSSN